MDLRINPVLPLQPAQSVTGPRTGNDARGPDRVRPEESPRQREAPARPAAEPRPVGATRASDSPAAARPEFPRVRIQPDLPPSTRSALEVFVRNSFSEEEDPATRLGGIDLFV